MTSNKTTDFSNKVGFAIGTGRCGTKFLTTIFNSEPYVASSHERHIENESFHRYCKWYNLPVDHAGFLNLKEIEVSNDLKKSIFSFEASAQLSSSICELYNHFRAKFLLIVRSPERVVNSFIRKGIYKTPYIVSDYTLAPGYQPVSPIHRFLGRITPLGDALENWNQLSQVGRIAWYWNAVNEHILTQFEQLPNDSWRIENIETFTYDRYCNLADFFGIHPKISEMTFCNIAKRLPNSFDHVPTVDQWSSLEKRQFEQQVQPMAEKLGFEFETKYLSSHKMNNQSIFISIIRWYYRIMNRFRYQASKKWIDRA